MKQQKLNCPNCGEKGQTTVEECGKQWFIKTKCSKCGKRCGALHEKPTLIEKTYRSVQSWSDFQKAELDHFQGDVVQPIRKDGTINENFVKVHGTKTLEKELKLPRETILREADRPTRTVAELRQTA